MTEKEYRRLPAEEYFSKSLLTSFELKGPSSLISNENLDTKKNVRFGKICHHKLLLPDTFEDTYIVRDFHLSETQMKICNIIIDTVNNGTLSIDDVVNTSTKYEQTISDIVLKSDIWNNIKKSSTLIQKLKDGNIIDYVDHRLNDDGKYVISSQEYMDACECAIVLKRDPYIKNYFISEDISKKQILFEIPIIYKIGDYQCKSILDSIIIDHENKTICFGEIKTSTSDYLDFSRLFLSNRRYIEIAMYMYALEEYMRLNGLTDYLVEEPYYIAVNRNEPEKSVIFKITKDWVKKFINNIFFVNGYRYNGIANLLKDVKWHFENKQFTLPRRYIEEGYLRITSLDDNEFIDQRALSPFEFLDNVNANHVERLKSVMQDMSRKRLIHDLIRLINDMISNHITNTVDEIEDNNPTS